jgi:hypothetical protein
LASENNYWENGTQSVTVGLDSDAKTGLTNVGTVAKGIFRFAANSLGNASEISQTDQHPSN